MIKVKYEGVTGFIDGLTKGQIYNAIGETNTQFIVNNDFNGISTIQKDEFEIQN